MEATNAILLDNGDFLQGNPLGDYIAYERGMDQGQMHPIVTALNTVGVDGGTLGNHEFNRWPDLPEEHAGRGEISGGLLQRGHCRRRNSGRGHHAGPPYAIIERELTDGVQNTRSASG